MKLFSVLVSLLITYSLIDFSDPALTNGAQASREEADARSVFVGNVITQFNCVSVYVSLSFYFYLLWSCFRIHVCM